jgi:4-oxalocrotonate tautomerase
MPHVSVKLYPGRSDYQKAELARAIEKDVIAILQCGEESVSVAIEDVQPGDWVEKVWNPEIAGKPDTLFKKPGYKPLGSGA